MQCANSGELSRKQPILLWCESGEQETDEWVSTNFARLKTLKDLHSGVKN